MDYLEKALQFYNDYPQLMARTLLSDFIENIKTGDNKLITSEIKRCKEVYNELTKISNLDIEIDNPVKSKTITIKLPKNYKDLIYKKESNLDNSNFLLKMINIINDGIEELPNLIDNWVKDSDGEDIDLENYEILSINAKYVEIKCGGDWQEPKTVKIGLVDNKLKVI